MVNGAQGASNQKIYSRIGQANDNHEQSSLGECLSITSSRSPISNHGILHSPTWSNDWHTFGHSDSSDWLSQSVASSTTTWSDELEGESAKKLGEQLERLENTLYNDFPKQELHSSNLVEECRQWQQFPHLRVVGVNMSIGCQTRSVKEEIEEQLDEIVAKHGDYNEEQYLDDFKHEEQKHKDEATQPNEEQEIFKEKIKKAVIDQIFAQIWPDVVKKIDPVFKELSKNQNVCDELIIEPKTPKIVLSSCGDSELVNKFKKLSVDSSLPLSSLRVKSGRKELNAPIQRNLTTIFPVKSVVIECNFPTQCSMLTVRNTSALQRSAKLNQSVIKYPSPERHLSPLQNTDQKRTFVKSAGTKKNKNGCIDKRQDIKDKTKPLYDPKVGRLISRDESRSGLRRNLKTSPPAQWSRHITLPPIESNDLVSKVVDGQSKRSTSALLKIGKPEINSRPNTSKNQITLDPNLMICSSKMEMAKQWLADQPEINILNSNTLITKSSDRTKWKSRGNTFRK